MSDSQKEKEVAGLVSGKPVCRALPVCTHLPAPDEHTHVHICLYVPARPLPLTCQHPCLWPCTAANTLESGRLTTDSCVLNSSV